MKAEHLVLNDSCQWQVIEELSELLPDIGIAVLSEAFIVETVHLCDLPALVVATQNGDSVLEAHFESYKQSDSLYTVVAAIDVITHEEVVCVWRLTSNFEKLTQVMELTVNITTYGDWRTHLLHV